ncbi:SEL1-like repeat protein [Helicobacter sp. L8]|uniref:tetratricopeptide repeat protein n=1 Tax=Helicobacter sp. L8 TaxID=2316078 RepID=UPI001F0998E6|nr:SEL1-like repeat protein [Helicobacter sp. L8]
MGSTEAYLKAADMGEPAAYNNLAIMYAHGKGVKPDKEKARQYYKKACAMGVSSSCQALKRLKHKSTRTKPCLERRENDKCG